MPPEDASIDPLWQLPPPSVEPHRDEVHVWRARLDCAPEIVDELSGLLSADERARRARFHFAEHRDRFAVARGLLRTILGRYLQIDPRRLSFRYGPQGKPELESAELRFNLSHSRDLVVYAIALNRELGVDVEWIHRQRDEAEIAERHFSRHEIADLRALPEAARSAGFFNCWTRKEAFIKARGLGLSLPLDSFDVSLKPQEPAALLRTHDDPEEASRWTLRELRPGEGYAGAVVVEGRDWGLRCWELER